MDIQFDFHLHADRSTLLGTQYFELAEGRYNGKHWATGSRFIDEYTFSLIEGIFEKHVPNYDHFNFVEVSRPTWQLILRDLSSLRVALASATSTTVTLPYGRILDVQGGFEKAWQANQHALATFLGELESRLHQTLVDHDVISVLGL